jgi:hypothetical protein
MEYRKHNRGDGAGIFGASPGEAQFPIGELDNGINSKNFIFYLVLNLWISNP